MNFIGVDFGSKSDNFAITNMEMKGSYKSPCPHDILYILKDFKVLYIAAVKEETPWKKKHE